MYVDLRMPTEIHTETPEASVHVRVHAKEEQNQISRESFLKGLDTFSAKLTSIVMQCCLIIFLRINREESAEGDVWRVT